MTISNSLGGGCSAEQTDNNKYMKVDINLLLIGKEYD